MYEKVEIAYEENEILAEKIALSKTNFFEMK